MSSGNSISGQNPLQDSQPAAETTAASPVDARAESPSKRRKIDDTSFIPIIVENDTDIRAFNIQKDLLIDNFREFRGKFHEVEEVKPLTIQDVTTEAFETVSEWLQNKQLSIKIKGFDEILSVDNLGSNIFWEDWPKEQQVRTRQLLSKLHGRIVEVYLVGYYYGCSELRNAAMFKLQRLMSEQASHEFPLMPDLKLLKYITDKITPESPLCRLMVQYYGTLQIPDLTDEVDVAKNLQRLTTSLPCRSARYIHPEISRRLSSIMASILLRLSRARQR